MELDKDGKPAKAEELAANIKTEWADFIVTTQSKGASVEHPPKNTGGTGKSREDILLIKNGVERRRAMMENSDLFPELATGK